MTNAVLSAQEQSREFVNHAGTAAASASVRDEAAAELQGVRLSGPETWHNFFEYALLTQLLFDLRCCLV